MNKYIKYIAYIVSIINIIFFFTSCLSSSKNSKDIRTIYEISNPNNEAIQIPSTYFYDEEVSTDLSEEMEYEGIDEEEYDPTFIDYTDCMDYGDYTENPMLNTEDIEGGVDY